jgi:hypothetical protein
MYIYSTGYITFDFQPKKHKMVSTDIFEPFEKKFNFNFEAYVNLAKSLLKLFFFCR